MLTAEMFWNWFVENKKRYYEVEEIFDQALYLELQHKLREYHPHLSFQIGGTLDNPVRTLTITANGKIENFSKVEELVCQAPFFKKWQVKAFKPADGFDIKVNVAGIIFNPKNLRFIPLELVHYPDLSAIRIYMPGYEEEKKDLYKIGMNALLEACLGEKKAATEINYVDIKSYPETPEEYEMTEAFVHIEKYIEYRNQQIKYN
ncbi:MAG: hypothetical protein AAF573_23300 [Bacteroidota bacterium]